jgi:glycosyltransferase involved in cell wall biosynthesis
MAERPLRILKVLRAPVGGLFRHVVDLTRGLVARGHAVGLVMDAGDAGPRWESTIADLAALAPLGVTRMPMPRALGLGDGAAVRHVLARIRAEDVDVVHGHGAKGGAYARIAATFARRAGRPARIYTPHGGSLHFAPRSPEGMLYRGLERVLAHASDAIVFESAFARAGFAGMLGRAPEDRPVIHNGLAPDEFEPVAAAADAADVVFVGELRHLKGVDVLIDALAAIPDATAVLVGAGPDAHAYHARVSERGLGGRVRFEAPMPARAAFALGHVVVAPSRAESFPYLVLEAAAAGKPLLATKVGGVPEIFGPLAAALLPPGDVEALTRALRDVRGARESALEQGEALRRRVRETFALDAMVNAILRLYRARLSQSGTIAA